MNGYISEYRASYSFWEQIQLYEKMGKLNCVGFHVPNEFPASCKKDILWIHHRKNIGLLPGAPDYVFVGREATVFLEFKVTGGKLSVAQKAFQNKCSNLQLNYYAVYGADEAFDILRRHNLLF